MATLTWGVFKHHRKADGTYNPKIKVYHKETTVYLATQIHTSFVRFRKGESTGTVTDGDIADALNARIREMRRILNRQADVVENLESAKAVVDLLDRKMNQDRTLDFIAFARRVTAEMPENGSKSVRRTLINNLCGFTASESLPVGRITSPFLVKFETWMKSGRNRPVRSSSVRTYMDVLRSLYNKMLRAYNDCDVSMEDVAMCLTHASVYRMTDTYVKPDFSRIDRTIRKVIDFVLHSDEESGSRRYCFAPLRCALRLRDRWFG